MKFTAWREGGEGSPFSIRRILATFFAFSAVILFGLSLPIGAWYAALPGGLCLAAALLLLFFTTWADVASAMRTATGKAEGGL
jgi:hypothetical protein